MGSSRGMCLSTGCKKTGCGRSGFSRESIAHKCAPTKILCILVNSFPEKKLQMDGMENEDLCTGNAS